MHLVYTLNVTNTCTKTAKTRRCTLLVLNALHSLLMKLCLKAGNYISANISQQWEPN